METRRLGRTELQVSRLGIGLWEIGVADAVDPSQVDRVLNLALDHGINFLDTAACYGVSEARIGRAVAHRRQEFILATKAGHRVEDDDPPEWSAALITHSIERSLRRLRTDVLDLVQLHSCDVEVLERGEVIQALQDARQAGKVRFIGYSGDNEAARWAVESGYFDTLQTSFNLVDQRARTQLFPRVVEQDMGLIVKRPIANGAWGASRSPLPYADEYFRRYRIMAQDGPIPGAPEDRIALALGFVLSHPEVHTAIVGTRNPEHLLSNIRQVEQGLRLSSETLEELYRRFQRHDDGWIQQI